MHFIKNLSGYNMIWYHLTVLSFSVDLLKMWFKIYNGLPIQCLNLLTSLSYRFNLIL